MSARVAGKVALITGAGTGIGRATAIRLAEEGAAVIVTSRTLANAEQTAHLIQEATTATPLSLPLDQTRPSQIEAAIASVADRYGTIDILVNSAGVDDPSESPVADTSDDIWDSTFDVNVTGVFRLCRAAIPILGDGGSIVNIGSTNSISPRPNAAAYCASKAAVLQLTRSLALELAPRGIRANCVCPGIVDTPLTDLFLYLTEDPAATRREYAASNPMRRIADPREIANCVLFLASNEASFVTGSALVADGGSLAGG